MRVSSLRKYRVYPVRYRTEYGWAGFMAFSQSTPNRRAIAWILKPVIIIINRKLTPPMTIFVGRLSSAMNIVQMGKNTTSPPRIMIYRITVVAFPY